MAQSFQNRQRWWTVYEATGDTKHPLRAVRCIRANAKSIAVGNVHREKNIPKRDLVAVEGCWKPGSATAADQRRGR